MALTAADQLKREIARWSARLIDNSDHLQSLRASTVLCRGFVLRLIVTELKIDGELQSLKATFRAPMFDRKNVNRMEDDHVGIDLSHDR